MTDNQNFCFSAEKYLSYASLLQEDWTLKVCNRYGKSKCAAKEMRTTFLGSEKEVHWYN